MNPKWNYTAAGLSLEMVLISIKQHNLGMFLMSFVLTVLNWTVAESRSNRRKEDE